ncbi:hypothetical protein [Sphingomonas sp.]|jgi:hypothetical protein|uniref:hypothetical protein n=1 Tax=Sphingomonas sp. TaxID=28214 RepID=UPI00260E18E7|nr:hypothetical protein [Sphingomonas sp.]MDF2603594.1 hypothetical protein [Sphingomonas sp.]
MTRAKLIRIRVALAIATLALGVAIAVLSRPIDIVPVTIALVALLLAAFAADHLIANRECQP